MSYDPYSDDSTIEIAPDSTSGNYSLYVTTTNPNDDQIVLGSPSTYSRYITTNTAGELVLCDPVNWEKTLSELAQRKEKTVNIYKYFLIDRLNNKLLDSGSGIVGRTEAAAASKIDTSKYERQLDTGEVILQLKIQTSYEEIEITRTKEAK